MCFCSRILQGFVSTHKNRRCHTGAVHKYVTLQKCCFQSLMFRIFTVNVNHLSKHHRGILRYHLIVISTNWDNKIKDPINHLNPWGKWFNNKIFFVLLSEKFEHMKKTGDYYVIVVEDTNLGQIVATATLITEHKFIHSCAKVLYNPTGLFNSRYNCNHAKSISIKMLLINAGVIRKLIIIIVQSYIYTIYFFENPADECGIFCWYL